MRRQKEKVALVAGGAGFVGSHLCDALLASGTRVICFDNFLTGRLRNLRHLEHEPFFDLVEGDIINNLPYRIRRTKFNEIYNLACAASPPHYQSDPEHTMLTSVVGTRNLLRLAEVSRARFLLASTSEVYGDPECHPQSESYRGNVSSIGPRACYDEGKRAAETLTFDFERAKRCEVRVSRIFNTYGPRMRVDDGRVISNMIYQALTSRDITIYGDGQQTRSFSYVDDLVDGLIRLMRHEIGAVGPVNLGNPSEMTIRDLAEKILAMTSSSSRVVRRDLPVDDPQRRRPDISRAINLLDWFPRVSLEDGLRATIAWFRSDLSDVMYADSSSYHAANAVLAPHSMSAEVAAETSYDHAGGILKSIEAASRSPIALPLSE